jgi:hypothetical protein
MNKLVLAFFLCLFSGVFAFSQTTDDDYKKNEYYVGFSTQQVDFGNYDNFNGFEVAYVRNIRRYVGLKADFSAAYRNEKLEFSGEGIPPTNDRYRFDSKRSLYNVLGGVQIKDNKSKARFKPFGQALAGVSINQAKFTALSCTSGSCQNPPLFDSTSRRVGFSGVLGGGLDIKINDKVDFRAIQVDYNPIYEGRQLSNNFRFGIGFVFK